MGFANLRITRRAYALLAFCALLTGCATRDSANTNAQLDLAGYAQRMQTQDDRADRQSAHPPAAFARLARSTPDQNNTATQATTQPTYVPPKHATNPTALDYPWQADLGDQIAFEAREFASRGLWRGFERSFWDVENALVLSAALGTSITLRETDVDGSLTRRRGSAPRLGSFSEPIQLLGHPGTHFAATGVLWLGSALARDAESHEVSKSLATALSVNALTTLGLKAATNTRRPNGERFGWPSGHTSSAFTAAAVIHEHYGALAGIPSFALAGLVGYQRIDAREHEFSDVVFGALLGTVIGSAVARDCEARFPELFGLEVIPFTDPHTGAAGLALHKSW